MSITSEPHVPRPTGHALATVGAIAGAIGPLLFAAGFIVQGLARRGEYDPVAEPVSALEAGPNGWLQQVNFIVFGLLMMIFASGLRAGVRRARGRILGPAIVAWWGVGLVLAGVLPLREDATGRTYDATGLHQINGSQFFLSVWLGLGLLSWWLHRDPEWRGFARYAAITAGALMPLFFVMGLLAMPESGPLHTWAGACQRVVLAIWFPCLVVLAARLWWVSRLRPQLLLDGLPAVRGEATGVSRGLRS